MELRKPTDKEIEKVAAQLPKVKEGCLLYGSLVNAFGLGILLRVVCDLLSNSVNMSTVVGQLSYATLCIVSGSILWAIGVHSSVRAHDIDKGDFLVQDCEIAHIDVDGNKTEASIQVNGIRTGETFKLKMDSTEALKKLLPYPALLVYYKDKCYLVV